MSNISDLPGAAPPSPGHPAGPAAPPPPRGVLDPVLDVLAWACLLVAGLSLVAIVVTFGWLVWGRYVMNDTPTWVEQFSLLLISYITFLGAAVGVRQGGHLSIDFVRESFPALPREAMRYLADLLVVGFGVLMAWQGTALFLSNLDRDIPMIDTPEGWRFLPLAVAGVLFVLFAGNNIVLRALNPMRERA